MCNIILYYLIKLMLLQQSCSLKLEEIINNCYNTKRLLTNTNACFYNNDKYGNNSSSKRKRHTATLDDMLNSIKALNNQIQKQYPLASISPKVLDAMAHVPRHKFVLEGSVDYAYNNTPLIIGYKQTISQPYIVAVMTSLLAVNKNSKVLEIGTGSGYQTAILATLASEVFTMEVISELARKAQKTLTSNGYNNIKCSCKDGKLGWKDHAPFDAIIVTAAASKNLLPILIEQLNINGNLVIPIENDFGEQDLFLITKKINNDIIIEATIIPVRFVPLT